MPTATAGDPRGPNRLQPGARRWVRKCGPMLYHIARARGVDPSQVTRELSGERRAELAKAEEQLLALARYPRTSPEPWLYYIQARVVEERLSSFVGDSRAVVDGLCDHLMAELTRASLAQLRWRSERTPRALGELEESVGDAGSRTLEILGYTALLRGKK